MELDLKMLWAAEISLWKELLKAVERDWPELEKIEGREGRGKSFFSSSVWPWLMAKTGLKGMQRSLLDLVSVACTRVLAFNCILAG